MNPWTNSSPKAPNWIAKYISYWGAPSGATYKVVKQGIFWIGYRYAANGDWFEICKEPSRAEAQEKCEAHEGAPSEHHEERDGK